MTVRRLQLRGEGGFTLIEVLVAWGILMAAVVSTFSVFTSSQSHTASAQRRAVMTAVAQREIERIRALPYASAALSGPATTASEGLASGPAASEPAVVSATGLVTAGPTPFTVRGVTGRIYRHVTWRSQVCTELKSKVAAQIDVQVGTTGAAASVGDICPAANQTKRITLVVVADTRPGDRARRVQSATLMADPDSPVQVAAAGTGLHVDTTATSNTGSSTQTEPEKAYGSSVTQSLYLYDTPCSQPAREAQAAGHETRDTATTGAGCSGSNAGDLMGLAAPPEQEPHDYSTDLLRSPVDGLALKRDTVGSCATAASYAPADSATRRWSIHRWATKPLAAAAETLAARGRATLTMFTHSVGGVDGAGRLCATVRRASDGQVLGATDFALASWPAETSQLDITFDLAHAALGAGDRLELVLRADSAPGNDLELLYDRSSAPSALLLTMAAGKGLS